MLNNNVSNVIVNYHIFQNSVTQYVGMDFELTMKNAMMVISFQTMGAHRIVQMKKDGNVPQILPLLACQFAGMALWCQEKNVTMESDLTIKDARMIAKEYCKDLIAQMEQANHLLNVIQYVGMD